MDLSHYHCDFTQIQVKTEKNDGGMDLFNCCENNYLTPKLEQEHIKYEEDSGPRYCEIGTERNATYYDNPVDIDDRSLLQRLRDKHPFIKNNHSAIQNHCNKEQKYSSSVPLQLNIKAMEEGHNYGYGTISDNSFTNHHVNQTAGWESQFQQQNINTFSELHYQNSGNTLTSADIIRYYYECNLCSRLLKKIDMGVHELSHFCKIHQQRCISPTECEIKASRTTEFNSPSDLKFPVTPAYQASYKCTFCEKRYQQKRTLDIHERKCLRKYECKTCFARFPKKQALLCHEKIHWLTTYDCKLCQQTFSSDTALTVHEQEHNFNCDTCNISFKDERDLQVHKNSHMSASPVHKCKTCSKVFLQEKSLKLHRMEHFECEVENCGESFLNMSDLANHCRKSHQINITSLR